MKVTINETQFATLLNGLRDFCASEGSERPALQSIYMRVEGTTISAYASNGYYAAKLIFDCDPEDWELPTNFSFCIKPFAFKPTKKGVLPVVITLEGRIATVEVTTSGGDTKKYLFKQTDDYPVAIQNAFEKVNRDTREVATVNIHSMLRLLRSVKKISLDGNATIFIGADKEIIVRPKVEGIDYEQFLVSVTRIGE